jgi:hypothetical protein
MVFKEILKHCIDKTVIINNREERTLVAVEEDFIILQGGNPQMKLTECVPLAHIVKVIRADYSTGDSSTSIDLPVTGGDASRSAAH